MIFGKCAAGELLRQEEVQSLLRAFFRAVQLVRNRGTVATAMQRCINNPALEVTKATAIVVVCLWLSACGCGPDGEDVRAVYPERVQALEMCAGGTVDDVSVVFVPTGKCPTSGRWCCFAGEAPQDCGDEFGSRCGRAGNFNTRCRVVTLPDECDAALEHELLHALEGDAATFARCE